MTACQWANSGRNSSEAMEVWLACHYWKRHSGASCWCSSVAQSCSTPRGLQHAGHPCPSLSPAASSNSCPLSQWFHPTILPSVTPFSSFPQSFPASGSFPMSWLFTSGSQSVGASASSSVFPISIQGWFPLGLTCLISLLSCALKGVFRKRNLILGASALLRARNKGIMRRRRHFVIWDFFFFRWLLSADKIETQPAT